MSNLFDASIIVSPRGQRKYLIQNFEKIFFYTKGTKLDKFVHLYCTNYRKRHRKQPKMTLKKLAISAMATGFNSFLFLTPAKYTAEI